jgi:hypothetical protein
MEGGKMQQMLEAICLTGWLTFSCNFLLAATLGLNIAHDPKAPSFIGANSVSFSNQLDLLGFGSERTVDESVAGNINLYELSLHSAEDLNQFQRSSFTLATLSFNALIEGMGGLDTIVTGLGDADGNPLEAAVNGARVQVTSVESIPEPMTLLLFITGLVGLRWLKLARIN